MSVPIEQIARCISVSVTQDRSANPGEHPIATEADSSGVPFGEPLPRAPLHERLDSSIF